MSTDVYEPPRQSAAGQLLGGPGEEDLAARIEELKREPSQAS